jgi:nucleotide-binding universal stress UspA family protein
MFHLQKILFPVDFSERAIGAGRYVRALTESFRADITLLHVVEPASHESGTLDRVAVRKAELQQFLQAELRPFRVSRLVREGDPARIINATAESEHCDLIMMPTHGWGIYRRFILGSVTAKVLHDASCAVWTCSHAEQAPPLKTIACRKILCAVDLGPQSKCVLEYGRDLAKAFGAQLILGHVCQIVELGSAAFGNQDVTRMLVLKAQESVGTLLEEFQLSPEVLVDSGDVSTIVQRMAVEHSADLVVIGRSTSSKSSGRLPSNAYSIIRQSPCPVISV